MGGDGVYNTIAVKYFYLTEHHGVEGGSSENAETQELTKRAILLLLSGRDRQPQYVGSAAGYGSSFFLIEQAARLLAGRLSDERKQAGESPGTPP